MKYRSGIILVFGIMLLVTSHLVCGTASSAGHCTDPVGTLVSIEGSGELQPHGQTGWQPVQLNDEFCAGDVLRVGPGGRAAVTLTNETILRINQNSTLNFSGPEERISVLGLLKGMLHIFSHRPRSLKVSTPYVNGTVEGTEFLVSTDERQTEIIVFEGLVRAANTQGSLDIESGQSITASKGAAPQYSTVVNPRDAVQWTLYYPTIVPAAASGTASEAVELVSQASAALQTGQVEAARTLLDKALSLEAKNSSALALLAIIDVVQNRPESALAQAQKAVDLAPDSAAAGLALSYAQQAAFDVDGALNTLVQTAESNPNNVEVLARLAELQLAVGRFDQALAAIDQAVALTPDNARVQAVQGFVHLTRVEIEEAQAAFTRAIELDQAMPLARLGLGLSQIRKGQVARGRAEIEIGAALDTSNAMIRSYLGKAFFEERRDTLAGRQYSIAKELDPADPTPWFYDAIRKQTDNRPVEALKDLQQSIALNDNRAVYRSRFLLDDDLAARSASLGRIYQDLGFQQLALAEGWKSVAAQPGNFSAHRFLSDSYRVLPRHEIARVSELLQSQLLQPLNINPVQPQLGRSDLAVLQGAGPGQATLNEYNSLFLRNRFALQASGVVGSNETLGDELVHSAVYNKLSYSIGQYYYKTDGIRENNDQRYEIYNGYAQGMVSPKTSWMLELRYDEDETGDLTIIIDPAIYDFSPTFRDAEQKKTGRVGFRHDFLPHSTLIGTAALSATEDDINDFFGLDFFGDAEDVIGELQHLYSSKRLSLQSGAGYFYLDAEEMIVVNDPFPFEIEDEYEFRHANIYSYAQIELPYHVVGTVGLSGDLTDIEILDLNQEELNPKLGLIWQPVENTQIRGAVFKTVTRLLVNAQTIEPTHIAGFNQFFDDDTSSLIWSYGVGLDQKFSNALFGGIQYLQRDLDTPFLSVDTTTGAQTPAEDQRREQIGSAYLYWAPVKWMSLGLEYFYEDIEQDENTVGEIFGVKGVTTHRVVPQVSFFHSCGFSARLWASYIDQNRDFDEFPAEEAVVSDQFWQVDAALSYRLPKRYGIVSLWAKNLFNEEFIYFDTDPANPKYLPEQQVFLSLTLQF